jgi:hypothetical protein
MLDILIVSVDSHSSRSLVTSSSRRSRDIDYLISSINMSLLRDHVTDIFKRSEFPVVLTDAIATESDDP